MWSRARSVIQWLMGLCALFPLPVWAEGAWVLTEVSINQPTISASACYPGRAAALADGSARFEQGYADCTGEGRVKGGERSSTTITWRFSQAPTRLEPNKPLTVTVEIKRQSDAVPYYGGGAAYFYFRNQSAVGGVELKGFLGNPDFPKEARRDITLDRVPDGQVGDKLTMWMNVSGESGIGDVFYGYEFQTRTAALPVTPPPAKDPADPKCAQYALMARQQATANIERGCGFSGERWSVEFNPHFAWCEAASTTDADLTRETKVRTDALAKCAPTVATPKPAPSTPPSSDPTQQDTGHRFSSLSGEVEVLHNGVWRFAKLNTILYHGDAIKTGDESSAIIGFADLSTYLVKQNSEIVVLKPPEKDSKIKLVVGNIMRNIRKMLKDGTMEVEMSQAVAGARGTVYTLGSDPKTGDTAAVLEGTIELRAKATGETRLLNAGQRVRITSRGFSAIETFDIDLELARWGDRFQGSAMDDIVQRVDAARAAASPPSSGAVTDQTFAGGAPSDAQPSTSTGPYGYWAVSQGDDGVKVGVIVPDYSATEYVGAVFFCVPQGGVRVSIDSPAKITSGRKVQVSLVVDGARLDYSGISEDKITDDGTAVVFNTNFNDPLFADLATARSIQISVGGATVPLPMRNSQKAFGEFEQRCRR